MRPHYILLYMLASLLCNCNHSHKSLSSLNGKDSVFLVVGSYSKKQDEGIKVFSFNQNTGEATYRSGHAGIANPSFLCANKKGDRIYAVS